MRGLWNIFYSFFKIGLFTFGGGYAMVPLIEREIVERKKWIPRENFLEMLTLAQSMPGPIALNTSVFVGYKLRGYPGAIAGILGIVVPAFTVILAVAIFFTEIRHNRWVDAAFKGMRPAVVALIIAPILGLARDLKWWGYILAAAIAVAVWYLSVSPVLLLIAGAAGGIAFVLIRSRKEVGR